MTREEFKRREAMKAHTAETWELHWADLMRGGKGRINPTPTICAGDSPIWPNFARGAAKGRRQQPEREDGQS